jgi:ribonuclease HI
VIKRVQHTDLGPGPRITIKAVRWNNQLAGKGIQVVYRWVPSHEGVEGNEEEDK